MSDRTAIEKMITQVLDGTEIRLKVDRYTMEENLENGAVNVQAEVHDERLGSKRTISGNGVGLVDAFFGGLVTTYSNEFPSLKSICFADFAIKARVDTGRGAARSDMAAEVTLRVENSDGVEFAFSHASHSITGSALAVVVKAVEFFINSERAFVAVYKALEYAQAENRPDSIARYTTQLSTLVEATSYSEVIAEMRKKLKS